MRYGASSKYNYQILTPIVSNSKSIYEVLRQLKLTYSGGNHSYISRRIKELKLDTSHFLGIKSNSGDAHVGGCEKLSYEKILVYNRHGRREKTSVLKRALIESGCKEKCEKCNQGAVWNDESLTLQIDHKNGDFLDNQLENIRFLCPNCHTQTKNYAKAVVWSNQFKTGIEAKRS